MSKYKELKFKLFAKTIEKTISTFSEFRFLISTMLIQKCQKILFQIFCSGLKWEAQTNKKMKSILNLMKLQSYAFYSQRQGQRDNQ